MPGQPQPPARSLCTPVTPRAPRGPIWGCECTSPSRALGAQKPGTPEGAGCWPGRGSAALTEVLPEVAPAGDQALPPGREDMRGGGQAHGLDVPAEGQGPVQLQHRHVKVSRVRVVQRVRGDAGHARPHRAGLCAAQVRRARVGHPLSRVLESAGQTDHSSRAHPRDRWQREVREALTRGGPQNPVITTDVSTQACQEQTDAEEIQPAPTVDTPASTDLGTKC